MSDKHLASQLSPVEKSKTPVFAVFGFDDNGITGAPGTNRTGGLYWLRDLLASYKNPDTGNPATFDGQIAKSTFFLTTFYLENPGLENVETLKDTWRSLYDQGHEIALHSHSHPHGAWVDWTKFPVTWKDLIDKDGWIEELELSLRYIEEYLKIPRSEIHGFRAPFLEYSDDSFAALKEMGFLYDSSIEEGWQYEQDGTAHFFPYTLDEGSPVSNIFEDWYTNRRPILSHPGLWETPIYTLTVPPDSLCEQYGVKKGLREKFRGLVGSFSTNSGKVNGLDWNLWADYQVNKEEFIAITTYSFDLHYQLSKAPFIFGAHSEIYTDAYEQSYNVSFNANYKDRQKAIESLMDHIASKPDSRFVTHKQLVDWMGKPVPLNK